MGKFYLENKHKWFLHQAEASHKKRMLEGTALAAAAKVVTELRFVHHDKDGAAPKHVRISEHNLAQLVVLSANTLIGHLDEASSHAMRVFLAENPHCNGVFPAVVDRFDDLSGAYILRLGIE